jgi:MerR family transcriptional regulator, light-induced transcriptional regulator
MPAKYSIKDLERLSGIKAHTLRIWEQRYGILAPERTATNIRWYLAEDLRKILNISVLNNHGIKISRIAQLSDEEINEQVRRFTENQIDENEQVTSLVIAMIEFDENRFEKIISGCILRFGFERTIETILFPFFRKIGVMWQTGSINPVQEHFISNLFRQKLIVAIDGIIPDARREQKTFVLFLPSNELHELSLLYYAYKIKARGHKLIYLGQSVPFDDLERSFDLRRPDYFLTIFTHDMKEINLNDYLYRLSITFPDTPVLVSGFQLLKRKISLPSNIFLFSNAEDIERYIQ